MKLYSSVDDFVSCLATKGYEVLQIPGSLLDGYICIAPDSSKYNFIFREVYINAYTSALRQRRCAKISKALQAEIDALRETYE